MWHPAHLPLRVGEDAKDKSRIRHGTLDARDIHEINPESNNHWVILHGLDPVWLGMIQNEPMRRYLLLACLLAVIGCGGQKRSIAGTWHVDPGSIRSSRIPKGMEKNQDWVDATSMLGQIEVTFTANPNAVAATGFGLRSGATWSLDGPLVHVIGAGDHWPAMVLDSVNDRIHMSFQHEADSLQMDLVREGKG